MIFDGRGFAKEIEKQVKVRVSQLEAKLKIVSVLVGDDPASVLYTGLKKKAAERVGITFEVVAITNSPNKESVISQIREIGKRKEVTGIMVQMPIPGIIRLEQEEIVAAIPLEKDIDGLRWEESDIVPATVRAVLSILENIGVESSKRFVVVGTHGSVGKPLVHFLRKNGVKQIDEINSRDTDPARIILAGEVVISCVGKAGLVRDDMVREGTVVIDVGISKVNGKTVGDMTQGVYQKASIAVPVPGGVGPVTVASLLENCAIIAKL